MSLLDFGLYRRMARLANEREQAARRDADVAQASSTRWRSPRPKHCASAEQRVAQADRASIRGRRGGAASWTRCSRTEEAEIAAAKQARREVELLGGVAAPRKIATRAAARLSAQAALAEADAEAERATVAADEAEKTLVALPPRSTLERVRQAHADRAALLAAQEKGQTVLDEQAAEVASTAAALHAAEEAAAEASKRLDEAQWEHRAHDLATTLVAGQPCPVCRQTVPAVPTEDDVADVDDARAKKRRADASVVAARQAHESADRHRADDHHEARLDRGSAGQVGRTAARASGSGTGGRGAGRGGCRRGGGAGGAPGRACGAPGGGRGPQRRCAARQGGDGRSAGLRRRPRSGGRARSSGREARSTLRPTGSRWPTGRRPSARPAKPLRRPQPRGPRRPSPNAPDCSDRWPSNAMVRASL